MGPGARTPTTRWIILAVFLLILLYAWKKPFQPTANPSNPNPVAGQEPVSPVEPLETYVPARAYDAQSRTSKGGLDPVFQPKLIPNEQSINNPDAPLFPAFKSSSLGLKSQLYNPYPDYNSRLWRRKWRGTHASCLGPHGKIVNGNPLDMLLAFRPTDREIGIFPPPTLGTYDDTGLDTVYCFDRWARYDPYGLNEASRDERDQGRIDHEIDWNQVDWPALQEQCFSGNRDRYQPSQLPNATTFWLPTENDVSNVEDTLHFPDQKKSTTWLFSGASYKPRSAVVISMNAGTQWTLDMTQYIRSLVVELSLHSGAEYEIILLVDAKIADIEIFADTVAYQKTLEESIPAEFVGNSVLYNKALLAAWYPKVSRTNDADTLIIQGMQLLTLLRPDLEFFWSLKMDSRYTGHHYQQLETMSSWSKSQPRRLLWERSSKFFIPQVHGNWSAFAEEIQNKTEKGGVWGSQRSQDVVPVGPDPPVAFPELDKYQWGVDEEADMITSGPIVDATGLGSADTTSGYREGAETPSRLAAFSIMTRFSKRLLRAMHHGQVALGTSMTPDRFAASTALHHGLKAVAFPLPMYLDFAKMPKSIDKDYNFKAGTDVYETLRKIDEEIGNRMTFFPSKTKETNFADELYKRWLGYGKDPTEKLCLQGLLLHSVKGV